MSVVFLMIRWIFSFCFFNDTATTEIYTLSLHDALPISKLVAGETAVRVTENAMQILGGNGFTREYPVERIAPDAEIYTIDRKSTRLNSSHANISYAVFCLKKK